MQRLAALLLLTLSLASGSATAQTGLDTSSLERFWQVYEMLQTDREPSDRTWDSLWATPGYALLETRERRRAADPGNAPGVPALTQRGKSGRAP